MISWQRISRGESQAAPVTFSCESALSRTLLCLSHVNRCLVKRGLLSLVVDSGSAIHACPSRIAFRRCFQKADVVGRRCNKGPEMQVAAVLGRYVEPDGEPHRNSCTRELSGGGCQPQRPAAPKPAPCGERRVCSCYVCCHGNMKMWARRD